MKKTPRALALFLLFATLLTAVFVTTSCDKAANAGPDGTYEGHFAFEFELNSRKHEVDLTASLTLNKDGTYTFESMQDDDFLPGYVEEGTYILEGDAITLTPTACQAYADAKWEMKILNADEQTSMTTKGTLKEGVFTATMRWNDSVWELTTDMQLKRVVESNAPAASAAHDAAKGIYVGEFALELQYGGGEGRPIIKNTHDIAAELVLDQTGTYTFACGHYKEYRGKTYAEKGTYTLSGDEITLVPAECLFMIKGGAGEMQTLTAEQQADMTTKGTIKDSTVTAKMRWLYNYHDIASEMQLVCEKD